MIGAYHSETFDNISPEKQERILYAAAGILGRDGISGARMAEIAQAAGISHGSLFTYFPTKDHLIRAVLEWGLSLESERFSVPKTDDFMTSLKGVITRAWETAKGEEELISLWLSLSLLENERFAGDILPLERDAAEKWKTLVQKGIDEKKIRADIDPRVVAFLFDAVVAQIMKSQASNLEKQKLDFLFAGVDDVPELILSELTKML